MKTEELNEILNDIYKIDPNLKDYNEQLKKIIFEIYYEKPDVDLDVNFKEELKKKLNIKINQIKKELALKPKKENTSGVLKNLKKINYLLFGSLGTVAVVIIAVYYMQTNDNRYLSGTKNLSNSINAFDFSLNIKNADKTFGSLSGITASNNGMSSLTAGLPMSENASNAPRVSSGAGGLPTVGLAEPAMNMDVAINQKIISEPGYMVAPYVPTIYKYVYTGSKDFVANINEENLKVLKRIKNNSVNFDNKNIFNTNILDLSKFTNLKINNISIDEDNDLGYSLYMAINEGTLSINKNWQKWPQNNYNYRDTVTTNTDEGNMLSSDEIIKISNEFISKYNIDLKNYSSPVVQTDYKIMYAKALDKANFYIPQNSIVIYPLKINGMEVYELYGEKYGISLNVDTKAKVVDSLYNLETQNYESSKYDLEKDADVILKIAENTDNYYNPGSEMKTLTINIKDPILVYTKIYKYENNKSDEYLVPAISFSVENDDKNTNIYGRKNIIIPITKESINESLKRIEDLKNNVGQDVIEGVITPPEPSREITPMEIIELKD